MIFIIQLMQEATHRENEAPISLERPLHYRKDDHQSTYHESNFKKGKERRRSYDGPASQDGKVWVIY